MLYRTLFLGKTEGENINQALGTMPGLNFIVELHRQREQISWSDNDQKRAFGPFLHNLHFSLKAVVGRVSAKAQVDRTFAEGRFKSKRTASFMHRKRVFMTQT